MILPRYRIDASRIPGAGRGLFVDEAVARGRVVIAPDGIGPTFTWAQVRAQGDAAMAASVRWFEERCTVSADWPDECFVNHDFEPNGLWHLGFVFAARDLVAGDELTVDYRHLLPAGEREVFDDARSGRPIVGYAWDDALALSTRALLALQAA